MTRCRPWILLLVGACLALGACTSRQAKFDAYVKAAKEAREHGDFDKAVHELKLALKLQPHDAAVNLELGQVELKAGDLSDAIFYLREAHRLDPAGAEAPLALAGLLMGSDHEAASKLVDEVLKRHPENPLAHARQAQLALLKRDTNAALTAAQTAVQLAPKKADAWLTLGMVQMARIRQAMLDGKEPSPEVFAAAKKALEKAFQLQGPGGEAQVDLARVTAATPGHEKEGQKALHDAILAASRKGNIQAMEAGIQDYVRRAPNKFVARVFVMRARVTADPSDLQAWQTLARLSEAEKAGEGEAVCRELVKKRPDDPRAQAVFVQFLHQQKGAKQALAHLDGLPKAMRNSAPLLEARVELLSELKRPDEAKAAVAKLKTGFPASPELTLAQAHLQEADGDWESAIETLRQGSDSDDPRILHLLAMAEFHRFQYSEAAETMTRAFRKMGHYDPDLAADAVSVFAAAGRWPYVLKTLTQISKNGVLLTEEQHIAMIRAQYHLGQVEMARHNLDELLKEPDPSPRVLSLFARHEGRRQPKRLHDLLASALKRHPDDVAFLRLRWNLSTTDAERQETLKLVEAARAHGVEGRALRVLHADIMLRMGKLDAALEDLEWILQKHPNAFLAQSMLVRALQGPKRRDQLIAELEKLRRENVLGPVGLQALAAAYGAKGQVDKQIGILEKLVAAAPQAAGPSNDLAYLLAERGQDLDRALDLARRAVRVAPQNATIADTLGFVYLKRGLPYAALAQFNTAAGLMSAHDDRALIHYHRSLALSALGKKKEAKAELAEAKKIAPGRTFSSVATN